MNALVLKWLTSSIVGLLLCSAIWLAGSVKMLPSAASYRLASVSGSAAPVARAHERAPRAAEFAASAATLSSVVMR